MLDSGSEEGDGSSHEHRRRHAFPADVADDKSDVIAIAIEVIQISSDALHRYKRSMERELLIIDEIVRQDTHLDILGYAHLVLHQFMLILHLKICFLVFYHAPEEEDEDNDTDDEDAQGNDTSPFDALPDDLRRNGNHELHVNGVHGSGIDHPMFFIVFVASPVLRRAVVRGGDEGTVRTKDEANSFVIGFDVVEYVFYPLDGKIISHDSD